MAPNHPNRPSQIEGGPWSEPLPAITPEEQRAALEWLKKAAERGVVVERKGNGGECSDLDGNISIYLLKAAGIITKDAPVHYVEHFKLSEFLKANPNVGMMIDISENHEIGTVIDIDGSGKEEIAESGQPHRDSLISVIADAEGKQTPGRIYFEHHGSSSTPQSGCSAMKVYRWLIALGALPEPDLTKSAEEDRGQGLRNIVEFVDAQDNKNYYGEGPFDIEQTVNNAFGLMQARVSDGRGRIKENDWLGRYNPVTGSYRQGWMELMARTGRDHAKQFSIAELESMGVRDAREVLTRVWQGIAGCRRIIAKLRREGRFIQHTESGAEVFIDQRRTRMVEKTRKETGGQTKKYRVEEKIDGILEKKGVDVTDILVSEGIRSRIIMGLDREGTVERTIVFFYHDPAMTKKAKEWQKARGGEILRNSIYSYTANPKESGE